MRRPTVAAAAALMMLGLGACTSSPQGPPSSSASEAPAINAHESGPASPIAYGLSVPEGAVQLGPVVRYRSPRLIEAYQPELEALRAEQAVEEQDDPTEPTESTEPTVPNYKPEPDSFADLDERPRPDTYVSLMRVDGDPTLVVRRMLADLAVLLPDADIVTDDLGAYCKATERRVTGCTLDTTSVTPAGREVRARLTVDPGTLSTRTANVASLTQPVMTLTLAYVGDPRDGQENRTPEKLPDPQDVEATSEDTGWIWPKMDEDAPADGPVIGGYTPPTTATVLLSGRRPAFAMTNTLRASIATETAAAFTTGRVDPDTLSRDVIADLNEVIVTTWGTTDDGTLIRTVHTLSARGNYLTLFIAPVA